MATPAGQGTFDNGIYRIGDVRLADFAGRKAMPIGDDGFARLMARGVFVDKSLLVKDVLDSAAVATLFCRPRRFGKTLAMTMLRSFLEKPVDDRSPDDRLFSGLAIWDTDGGCYRDELGVRPVVYLSLNTAKRSTWEETREAVAAALGNECLRHGYLAQSAKLTPGERNRVERMGARCLSDGELVSSLGDLMAMLAKHHGRGVVLLLDEYDMPIVGGYSHGFYQQAIDFMRPWLTGVLKDGGTALDFACLTGVQRIAKESIFSGLNNLVVNTPLSLASDERFGFTAEEVGALASYLGRADCVDELREWYDGYRFGDADIYNPWSVLNYFASGCTPGAYWGNTSDNLVVADLIAGADERTMQDVYRLLEPGATVDAPLDMDVVFSELDTRGEQVWSMLYLSGYLTTDDVAMPLDTARWRALRIPNREVAGLFRDQVVDRAWHIAGGQGVSRELQEALSAGCPEKVEEMLARILLASASYYDLRDENSYHLMLFGLLFGLRGYRDPLSNREAGYGRYDIFLAPLHPDGPWPAIIVEVKVLAASDVPKDPERLAAALRLLAASALSQIGDRAYTEACGASVRGCLCYGVAFCGKHVSVACSRGD